MGGQKLIVTAPVLIQGEFSNIFFLGRTKKKVVRRGSKTAMNYPIWEGRAHSLSFFVSLFDKQAQLEVTILLLSKWSLIPVSMLSSGGARDLFFARGQVLSSRHPPSRWAHHTCTLARGSDSAYNSFSFPAFFLGMASFWPPKICCWQLAPSTKGKNADVHAFRTSPTDSWLTKAFKLRAQPADCLK